MILFDLLYVFIARDGMEPVTFNKSGFPEIDPETMQTNLPNVWVGGDLTGTSYTTVEAVNDGKQAAWHMHRYLQVLGLIISFNHLSLSFLLLLQFPPSVPSSLPLSLPSSVSPSVPHSIPLSLSPSFCPSLYPSAPCPSLCHSVPPSLPLFLHLSHPSSVSPSVSPCVCMCLCLCLSLCHLSNTLNPYFLLTLFSINIILVSNSFFLVSPWYLDTFRTQATSVLYSS